MVQINWTFQAKSDLQDIAEYISKDSKNYAKLQILKIIISPIVGSIRNKIINLTNGSILSVQNLLPLLPQHANRVRLE